jgi:hypothetical protein
MSSPELDLVDVARDGRWAQVALLEVASADEAARGAQELFASRPEPFVGVISADLGPELREILAGLRPALQEIVWFDSLTLALTVPGQDLAMRALEELGFGQDFVFTVERLEGAVDHAVDTLLAPEHGGWEGRLVVVLGPRAVIDRARRHLTEPLLRG